MRSLNVDVEPEIVFPISTLWSMADFMPSITPLRPCTIASGHGRSFTETDELQAVTRLFAVSDTMLAACPRLNVNSVGLLYTVRGQQVPEGSHVVPPVTAA